ncbi:MAG: hypothetical protein Q9196_002690 [Gyalolechia fulgens]
MPTVTSPGKSVLRPSSNTTEDRPTPPTLSRDDRNRQLALHHAHLLQYRKDIEARNLAFTETLLDLPSFATVSPSEISSTDNDVVKEALKTFQPSDYDALVEERNIDNRCGYVLCPRKNRSLDAGRKYRIVTGSKGSDFRVVEPKELGKWCSDECGKMALYLRVQLSEEPAWTREWQAAGSVELYSERRDKSARLARQASKKPALSVTEQRLNDRMADLAIERGEKGKTESLPAKVGIDLRENVHGEGMVPTPPCAESTTRDYVEGYVPTGRHVEKQPSGRSEDEEDLMPTI